nr:MAG TPA_asm: hypothetical protein [Caudoviricetes sp.]
MPTCRRGRNTPAGFAPRRVTAPAGRQRSRAPPAGCCSYFTPIPAALQLPALRRRSRHDKIKPKNQRPAAGEAPPRRKTAILALCRVKAAGAALY